MGRRYLMLTFFIFEIWKKKIPADFYFFLFAEAVSDIMSIREKRF